MLGSSNLLEDEYKSPYETWKKNQTPAGNAAALQAFSPIIEGAIKTHVGTSSPILNSRARLMALDGLRSYDPKRGRLQSHLYNHLLGLKRISGQQQQIVRIPERVAIDRGHLDAATKELQARLGREPTDDELSDYSGFSVDRLARVRLAQSGLAEGSFDEGGTLPASRAVQKSSDLWSRIVYDELDDYHKKIFELAWGRNGRRPLQNQEIARRMNRSPGAISQAKLRIQKMLDDEYELSPFGV